MAACHHCQREAGRLRRGLCIACYGAKDIRAQYARRKPGPPSVNLDVRPLPAWHTEAVALAIREAVAKEREACAALADATSERALALPTGSLTRDPEPDEPEIEPEVWVSAGARRAAIHIRARG